MPRMPMEKRWEPDPYFLFSSDDEWLRQSRVAGTF